MRRRLTTTCCSALALTFLCACITAARQRAEGPSPFFPIRPFWTLALNAPLTAPPAYGGGKGFFAIEGGRLAAYDLASGRQLWIADVAVTGQPAVGDGLVFVATADAIAALHDADGTVAWRSSVANPLAVPLVWDNGWLIAADAAGSVLAYRAADGRSIWQYDAGAQVHARPALAADRVYLALSDNRLIALRVTDGTVAWERRLGGPGNDILALDSVLYLGATDNFFYAIAAGSGNVLWRWQTGGDVIGKPAADGSRVYFVSLDNVLRGLSRRTGAQLWKRPLPIRPSSGPVLAGTTLLVAGLDPVIRVYAGRDGAPGTDIHADNIVAAPPVVVDVESLPNPLLLYATSDLAKGAAIAASTHSLDPAIVATVSPLPKLIKP